MIVIFYHGNLKDRLMKVLPYSDKFWRGENLAQLVQNGKNRQIKSTPKLIFLSLRQIKSIMKKNSSNKKVEICFHTVNILNRVFSL